MFLTFFGLKIPRCVGILLLNFEVSRKNTCLNETGGEGTVKKPSSKTIYYPPFGAGMTVD